MNISSDKYSSIERMRDQLQHKASREIKQYGLSEEKSFEQILQYANDVDDEIKFSKHANERMIHRKIELTMSQTKKLQEGINLAKAKGIKESLVVVDGISFIVSCKNNTVITAVGKEEEHIFTNIDGAVIM